MDELNASVFAEFPILRTKRLALRAIELKDAAEILKMRSDGRVNEFIARNPMASLESANELVIKCKNSFEKKEGIAWAGVVQKENVFIGSCGFNRIDHLNRRAEIGGELSTGYWGKKFALEAVESIVSFGFEKVLLNSIEAKVSPLNRSAIYLLDLLGFKKEAHFRNYFYFNNQFHDLSVYTMHRENFFTRPGAE